MMMMLTMVTKIIMIRMKRMVITTMTMTMTIIDNALEKKWPFSHHMTFSLTRLSNSCFFLSSTVSDFIIKCLTCVLIRFFLPFFILPSFCFSFCSLHLLPLIILSSFCLPLTWILNISCFKRVFQMRISPLLEVMIRSGQP